VGHVFHKSQSTPDTRKNDVSDELDAYEDSACVYSGQRAESFCEFWYSWIQDNLGEKNGKDYY